ncbi:MAG: hypothetical protein R2880_16235 [Deinococcales bacterium]
MLSIGGKVGKQTTTRKSMRQEVEPQFSELIAIIDDIQQEIKWQTKKKLICLIDGTDKASIETAEKLFYKHGKYLTDPTCSVVYSFPTALQHNTHFNQVRHYFSESYLLPNFRTQMPQQQAAPDPETEKQCHDLKEVICKRMAADLLEPEALDALVHFSGGIVRSSIMLTQRATLKALIEGKEKIKKHHVDIAINEERRIFDRLLSEKQKGLLEHVRRSNDIDADPEAGYLELLHNLSIIEYANGHVWYGVNPVVHALLRED